MQCAPNYRANWACITEPVGAPFKNATRYNRILSKSWAKQNYRSDARPSSDAAALGRCLARLPEWAASDHETCQYLHWTVFIMMHPMPTIERQITDPDARRCLAGARCWLITAGKAGMLTQANAIADALGVTATLKKVEPKGIWRLLAPRGPVAPSERFGKAGSRFAPPWPQIAIAVGRASIPYIRALRSKAGTACFTVVLQDPKTGPDTADLIWVPAHDKRRGPNVISTVISPHSFSPDRLATLRQRSVPAIDALPEPRVAVILGGRNAVYKYTADDDRRLLDALEGIAEQGASFLITSSRRTHPELAAAVDRATAASPRIVWSGGAPEANPYADFLARADYFIVTADSVNMTGEASATGRPIYVFHPSGGSAKFTRYHRSLEALGATRRLADHPERLENWSYAPQDATDLIVHEIEKRYFKRSAILPGSRCDTD